MLMQGSINVEFSVSSTAILLVGIQLFKHISWSGIHYNFIGKKIRKRRHGFLTTLQESRIKKWQQ
jgi:hypothetical protein